MVENGRPFLCFVLENVMSAGTGVLVLVNPPFQPQCPKWSAGPKLLSDTVTHPGHSNGGGGLPPPPLRSAQARLPPRSPAAAQRLHHGPAPRPPPRASAGLRPAPGVALQRPWRAALPRPPAGPLSALASAGGGPLPAQPAVAGSFVRDPGPGQPQLYAC